MELRARILPLPRRAAWLAALVALAATAFAVIVAPAQAAAKKKAPVITSVSPMDVGVGEQLTIRGRHFRIGRDKNTVVFKRDGARAVFTKAAVGTRKMLRLTVPDSLQEFFSLNAGTPLPTKFRLRVLAKKFGKRFTRDRLSPIVSAARPPEAQTPVAALPKGDCDGDGAKNEADGDDDNDGLADDVELSLSLDPCIADTDGDGVLDKWEFDCDRNGVLNRDEDDDDKDLLSDASETAIGTNPCALDSDGDGVEDGFEYQSAKDLNDDEYQDPNQILPYPGKRPYPNPLFADSELDYDGDSLRLADEQALWQYTYRATTATRTLSPMSYSDGMQYTLSPVSDTNHRRCRRSRSAVTCSRVPRLGVGERLPNVHLAAGKVFEPRSCDQRPPRDPSTSTSAAQSSPTRPTRRLQRRRIRRRRRARRGRRRPQQLRRDARPAALRLLVRLLRL